MLRPLPLALVLAASYATAASADSPPAPPAPPAGDAAAAPADGAGGIVAGELTEAEALKLFKARYSLVDGPTPGDLGNATIQVPAGYAFTGAQGAQLFQQDNSARSDPDTIGMIAPDHQQWILLFQYEDTGHVKDDDKDEIDANALLESYQEGAKAGNEARRAAGIPEILVDGWDIAPHYNDQVKLLEWAIRGHSSENERIVNFNSRILGRTGVTSAVLLFGGDVQLKDIEADFRKVLGGFAYKGGHTYGEYKEGDKLAEYGLAALVAGGGVAVAAKTGLLSKLGLLFAKAGKLIIVAVVGLGAVIAKLFNRNK